MQAHREEITLSEDGIITLRNVPFRRGESVEVIILPSPQPVTSDPQRPLEGTPVTLLDPFEPVAEGDWGAANLSISTPTTGKGECMATLRDL